MNNRKPSYPDRFVGEHGRARYFIRRTKGKHRPGDPRSESFRVPHKMVQRQIEPTWVDPKVDCAPDTFDQLVRDYFRSTSYQRLAKQTQKTYASVIRRFLVEENVGHRLVREMTRQHVQCMIAKRAATPGAANQLLKKLKVLLHFAIDNGWRTDDPTLRIKKFPEGEFHTWTEVEINQFEKAWPIGSRERMAFGLFLYTGQRTSDVARMSWHDVSQDGIWVVQDKTKAKLLVPFSTQLRRILAASTRCPGVILQTSYGRPFTSKGLSNFMADCFDGAGLPRRCVTHGLRKAVARRLAEAGCSANEIASITGHASLQEVARYTKAAEQRTLARAAINRLAKKQPRKIAN